MSYTIEHIARVCHEANRAHCMELGDATQCGWDSAPEWQRSSARKGVEFHLMNPTAGPAASHESWMREKLAAGWVFGPFKDPVKKEHPCMVAYEQLPAEQQLEDSLFIAIVHAFAKSNSLYD